MTDAQKEILQEAIKHYGAELQVNVAIEEMSELTKELCKSLRYKANRNNITEEIADVLIMIEQLKIIFQLSPAAIENVKEYKLLRLEKRIFKETRLK